MCFKAPKPPPVVPDPNFTIQREAGEQEVRDNKSANKDSRTANALALLNNRYGRGSLFTGSTGGMGYAAPAARSLFVQG